MRMFIDDVVQDVRYAARAFLRTPGFTLVAILTLALGIGANTAIFSVVNGILLRPLPYKDAEGLVRIFGSAPPTDNASGPARRLPAVQVSDLAELRARTQTLSHVIFYVGVPPGTLIAPNETVRAEGVRVSPETFAMLGAQPLAGRVFDAKEALSGADAVMVLSDATARRFFGAAAAAVGRSVTLDGRQFSIVGVMRPEFRFPDGRTQFWLPLVPTDTPRMGGAPIGRLKGGVSLQAATAEVSALLSQIREARATTPGAHPPAPAGYELVGLQDLLVAPVRPALTVLAAAVGFVLLIACVNVANLLLARTAARRRETAIRLALGAGGGRLVRQVLTESVLLALAGGVAGTVLALGGLQLLRTLGTGLSRADMGGGFSIPRLDEIGIDGSVLAFTLVTSVLTGMLFGLAPALRVSRPSPMDTLREGAGSSGSGFRLLGRNRTQGLLVVAEIAMAMMLLVGGGLLIESFVKLTNVDSGFDASHALTAQVSLPRARYAGARLAEFGDELVARLQRIPGVRAAGYARQLPTVRMRQITLLRSTPEMPAQLPMPPPFDGRQLPEIPDTRFVSRDFLTAMGVRLIAGRGLTEHDGAGHPQVLLVNRTLARSGILGPSPIGKQVYALGNAPWEVVGIVEDVHQFGLDREADPQIYVDFRQQPPPTPDAGPGPPPAPYFVVRTTGDPFAVTSNLRALVHELEPLATVDNVNTMEQIISNSLLRPRLYAVLLGVFAVVAVVLAAIGIYGVMAYSVAQRTREIGIRMALGARRGDVMTFVLAQSMVVTGAGIAGGLLGAASVTRFLEGMLFGLTPLDPTTFITVAMVFATIATLASYVPARRATKVDPLIALRCE